MDKKIQDRTLIEQCIDCDKRSWREFVDAYIKLIYNAVYNSMARYTHYIDKYDVEDVCQIVLLSLFANDCRVLKKFDSDKATFSTWLTIISRNAAIDYIRKKKSQTVTLEEALETVHCQQSDEPTSIDIPDAVISPRQHLVLRMMYDDGLDVAEIAFFLGVQRQTVRSLHHRALKKLRDYYGASTSKKPVLKTVNSND